MRRPAAASPRATARTALPAPSLTQAELAQLACVGISTVASIEGGYDGIAFGNVLKVLDAMGLLAQSEELFSLQTDPEIAAYVRSELAGVKD